MDFFGRKAKAELAALKADYERQADGATRFIQGLNTQLTEAKEAKNVAVKRCFAAEDLMQEFVSSAIPTADLRKRARAFLSGN